MNSIRVPTLCIQAENDPISGSHAIPYEIIKKNPNIMLLLTKSGGHIGFLEGNIFLNTWFPKPAGEFF